MSRLRTWTHGQAVIGMVMATMMWSMAGVVTRQLEHARSFEITFWRSFFTVLSLLVILPLWQGMGVFRRMQWRSRTFWLSGACWCVMFTAFMIALTLASVGNVLVTMAIGPLLTALGARLFIGHRLPLRTWCAIALAGLGIAYMFGSQLQMGRSTQAMGMLVALCVPIAGAIQWTLTQRGQAQGEAAIDLVPCVLVGAVLSAVLMLPLSIPFTATPTDVAWLGLLGLVQLAIPCVMSVVCARVLLAPEVSLLALLEVIFGILLAWVGAGEVPGPTMLVGGALVVGAMAGNEWLGWRQRHA